jgi:hypothetical protein
MTPAIQHPAPAFTVTALVDGEFKEVSLKDYVGRWYICAFSSSTHDFLTDRAQGVPLLLSSVGPAQIPRSPFIIHI